MMKGKLTYMKKISIVCALVFLTLVIIPAAAVASSGSPMYAWGNNANGQLGQGDFTNRNQPTRIGEAENWVQVSTAALGAVALNAEGHLYAWGHQWTSPQMGQGDNLANPGEGFITSPERVGDRDNWIFVFMSGSAAAAINAEGHLYTWGSASDTTRLGHGDTYDRYVPTRMGERSDWASVSVSGAGNFMMGITTSGHLWAWGHNGSGQLGQGVTSARLYPVRVAEGTYFDTASAAGSFATAITVDGHLYAWGINSGGQLGIGHNLESSATRMPSRVGEASNWVDTVSMPQSTLVLNSSGQIYTFGNATSATLARPVDADNPANRPGRVGDRTNWVAIGGGNGHRLLMNEDLELYAWGNNNFGQLGIGTTGGYESAPVFVLQTYGLAGFSQTGAGTHSMALIRTESFEGAEAYLEKRLQKPEGTNLLEEIDFVFTFERYSFNGNTANSTQVPPIPNRTITLSSASPSTTAVGITTTTGTKNVLDGIEFTQPGIYSWLVRELPTAGIIPPSNIVDSLAEYEIRVYVAQDGVGGPLSIYAITIHRLYCSDGEAMDPPYKTNDFSFTNIYTRMTTGGDDAYGAFFVSKTVLGTYANVSTVFDFDVTITRTAFCSEGMSFVGQIYEDDTPVGIPIFFNSGTASHVQLTHGQRLVFDEFLVGTRFTVTERAHVDFTASVDLLVNGSAVIIAPNDGPGQELSIGGPHFAGDCENFAAFTNTHFHVPPTGLVMENPLLALPLLVLAALIAALSIRKRRAVEQLPIA